MSVQVEIDRSKADIKLGRIDQATRTALRGTIVSLTQAFTAIVRNKLDGPVLKKRSGELYKSIHQELVENTASIYSRVYSDPKSPAAKYAAIHEFGGTINHPGSSKFQAFMVGGQMVYTHRTSPHQIVMPERSYMRSTLDDMRDKIVAQMTAAAKRGAKEA